jgi:hypothetical protein
MKSKSKKTAKKSKATQVRIDKDKKIIVLKQPAQARRAGTGAFKRYSTMAKIGGPRRTVKAARAAGYRSDDLKWDLRANNVRLAK